MGTDALQPIERLVLAWLDRQRTDEEEVMVVELWAALQHARRVQGFEDYVPALDLSAELVKCTQCREPVRRDDDGWWCECGATWSPDGAGGDDGS